MNNHFLRAFGIICITLVLFSCKSSQRASRKPLEGEKTSFLLAQMDESQLQFKTLSAKAGISFFVNDRKTTFNVNLRMFSDSAIWISITPLLGIEMARVLITKDSVKVIDRLDKQYFLGNFDYINKKFNLDIEFAVLQSLLIGNKIIYEEDDKDLKFAIDKDRYYLGNLRKRKAKKVDENPQKIERKNEELVSIWLNPENFKITELILTDLTADRFIKGEYSDHQLVNGQLFPMKLDFSIQSERPSNIIIEYTRVQLNEEMNLPFNISRKYEQTTY